MHTFVSRGILIFALSISFGIASSATVRAQDDNADAEGCKDSPLVSRFPRGRISGCENKYEQAEMPVGTDKDGDVVNKTFEGEYHYWSYSTHEGVSEIQVFRNFQNALRTAGFTLDYQSQPETITAHKGNTWLMIDNRGEYYNQTILTVTEMKQEVTADASSLADAIASSGRVAVYGINFDTAKATILPESEKVLTEISTLLNNDASLKLRIEGYTDNVGQAGANQLLSEQRAKAVVAWLTTHGWPRRG